MTDTMSPSERSECMRRIRSKNTKPEMAVRRLVHGMGFRYRLHRRTLPGTPDLVFSRLRKVVFVHGCFWHLHPASECKSSQLPKSRLDYWKPKLEANRRRDEEHRRKLIEMGWEVLTIWECQIKDSDRLSETICLFLKGKTLAS